MTADDLRRYLTKRGFVVSVKALGNGYLIVTGGQVAQISSTLAATQERGPFVIAVKRRSLWKRLLRAIRLT